MHIQAHNLTSCDMRTHARTHTLHLLHPRPLRCLHPYSSLLFTLPDNIDQRKNIHLIHVLPLHCSSGRLYTTRPQTQWETPTGATADAQPTQKQFNQVRSENVAISSHCFVSHLMGTHKYKHELRKFKSNPLCSSGDSCVTVSKFALISSTTEVRQHCEVD